MARNRLIDDALAVVAPNGLSRRAFVRASVGTGFAAATLPILAQTVVQTTATGLDSGEVDIPVGSFNMPAYRAVRAGVKNAPVVLVVSEVFGVHEHIADVARRFAHLGYCAIAPELFVRQGDAGNYGEISKLIAEVISQVPDAQVMTDLDACVAWAGQQGMDTKRLAITGFCWGGRITWLYAAHQPAVKAGVAWYGRLEGEVSTLNPVHPVSVVGHLRGPVLGLYGGKDTEIPLHSTVRMRAAMAHGSAPARASKFVVYPDAPHAFHADYRPSYRKDAADDGWKRLQAWFKSQGVI